MRLEEADNPLAANKEMLRKVTKYDPEKTPISCYDIISEEGQERGAVKKSNKL